MREGCKKKEEIASEKAKQPRNEMKTCSFTLYGLKDRSAMDLLPTRYSRQTDRHAS